MSVQNQYYPHKNASYLAYASNENTSRTEQKKGQDVTTTTAAARIAIGVGSTRGGSSDQIKGATDLTNASTVSRSASSLGGVRITPDLDARKRVNEERNKLRQIPLEWEMNSIGKKRDQANKEMDDFGLSIIGTGFKLGALAVFGSLLIYASVATGLIVLAPEAIAIAIPVGIIAVLATTMLLGVVSSVTEGETKVLKKNLNKKGNATDRSYTAWICSVKGWNIAKTATSTKSSNTEEWTDRLKIWLDECVTQGLMTEDEKQYAESQLSSPEKLKIEERSLMDHFLDYESRFYEAFPYYKAEENFPKFPSSDFDKMRDTLDMRRGMKYGIIPILDALLEGQPSA